MKINKRQLQRIIKEEISKLLKEGYGHDLMYPYQDDERVEYRLGRDERTGTVEYQASQDYSDYSYQDEAFYIIRDDDDDKRRRVSNRNMRPIEDAGMDDDESPYDRGLDESDPTSPYYGGWGREGE